MDIKFYKYHGTGNDFVLIDAMSNPSIIERIDCNLVAAMCHRRFGIGADGLMILTSSEVVDFRMIYYNSDGNLSSMCGNGGRCISKFAFDLGYIDNHANFEAVDGIHEVQILGSLVSLGMNDVSNIETRNENTLILDTGSPHYVSFVEGDELKNIVNYGRKIRYSEEFFQKGINVNLACHDGTDLHVATYERGVEDETYSCGTGVVASALSYAMLHNSSGAVHVITRGGELTVSFIANSNGFEHVKLLGPAEFVFQGVYED